MTSFRDKDFTSATELLSVQEYDGIVPGYHGNQPKQHGRANVRDDDTMQCVKV